MSLAYALYSQYTGALALVAIGVAAVVVWFAVGWWRREEQLAATRGGASMGNIPPLDVPAHPFRSRKQDAYCHDCGLAIFDSPHRQWSDPEDLLTDAERRDPPEDDS